MQNLITILLIMGLAACSKKKEEDTTAPTVSLTGISTWQVAAATASVSCTDNTSCDASSVKYKWLTSDSACPTDYTSYTDTATISSHLFVCAAQKDSSGNTGFTANPSEFKVTTTLTLSSDGLLYGSSYSKSSTSFTISNSTSAGSSLSKVCAKTDSTTCDTSDFIDYASSSTVDVLTSGAHKVYITVKDASGNTLQNSVDVYVQNWSTISATGRPFSTEAQALLSKGNILYFWVDSSLHSYDLSTSAWATISGAPVAGSIFYKNNVGFVYESNICLWSGANGAAGSCYNLNTSTWTSMPTSNAPSNIRRSEFGYALVGSKFCIWGGWTDGTIDTFNDGSCFDVLTNTWTATASSGSLTSRRRLNAVATEDSFCLWGGYKDGSGYVSDGACYNVSTNIWTSISSTDSPAGKIDASFIYTGSNLCSWGGQGTSGSNVATGACYSFTTSSWSAISTTDAPSARAFMKTESVWTGKEMCMWSGQGGGNDGYCYNPTTDTWRSLPITNSPNSMYYHLQVWTGNKFCAFYSTTGACYNFAP
jgi:hypothetical protein